VTRATLNWRHRVASIHSLVSSPLPDRQILPALLVASRPAGPSHVARRARGQAGMGKKHAAGGGWFAAVRKVFRPSGSGGSSATTTTSSSSSKDKDKDAVQHGKQVGAPDPPLRSPFCRHRSALVDELALASAFPSAGVRVLCHAMPWYGAASGRYCTN
jgi:hypothetical protein